jgi:predicted transposase YbfD/YdcC
MPKLLDMLPTSDRGVLITADAMHCQQETCRVITQQYGWDYLFGLKGNQTGILQKATSLLSQQGFPP